MSETPRSDSPASAIYSDQRLTETFIAQVTEAVDQRIRERENMRQWQFGAVATAVAIVGITGMTAYMDGRIATTVSTHAGLDRLKQETNSATTYQGLVVSASQIRSSTEFSPGERDAVIAALRDISGSQEIRRRIDFPVVLERVIDTFAAAGLGDGIDEIVTLFPQETAANKDIVVTLISHYGQRLVGADRTPDQWEEDDRKFFRDFVRAARKVRFPEAALPWELAVSFLEEGRTVRGATQAVARRRKNLDMAELAAFHVTIIVHSNTAWFMRTPTVEGEAIAGVFTDLRREFEEAFAADLSEEEVAREAVQRLIKIVESIHDQTGQDASSLSDEAHRIAARAQITPR